MPIRHTLELRKINDQEFSDIDSVVMECAYATHNRFGRLFDEQIYENDLADRLRRKGLTVYTQVPVKLTHGDFAKVYFLDLIANEMLYELKVVRNLTEEHEAQALHYAMLQDVYLVKLINFGEAKVRGKLLRNALENKDRYRPTTNLDKWRPLGIQCEPLLDHINELIDDWGTHLDSRLYNEALVHHSGGKAHCLKRMELLSGELRLGTHLVQQHDQSLAFVVTGFTKPQQGYRHHLQMLLEHMPSLRAIQWFNLNHSCLEVTTIGPDLSD